MKYQRCLFGVAIFVLIVVISIVLFRGFIFKQPQVEIKVIHEHPSPINQHQPPVNQHNNTNNNIPYTRRIMSGIPRDYTPVGYLENKEQMYPLYGRASRTNAQRWNYHTITDKLSNIRLPVQSEDGRNCTLDMGCDELYDGHVVTVPGVLVVFHVHVYPKEFF